MAAGLVVAVLGLSLLAGAGLYLLVRAEHDRWETMSRDDAEERARRDRD